MMSFFKDQVLKELAKADVKVGGDRPWDIKVLDERLYKKAALQGNLGLGEAYMDGWWECEALDQFFYKLLRSGVGRQANQGIGAVLNSAAASIFNLQDRTGSRKVIDEHYDLGNDLYMAFLDPYNQYTCGYFKDTDDLNKAQEQKLELICRKLQLKPSDRVLDIGCGWGGFAKYAAQHYGCHVTGISISAEQIAYAKEYTAGLPVEILNTDYRDLTGTFDKILICGMIEHVGYKNYREIVRIVHDRLADDGLFLLHTMGFDVSVKTTDPWMSKYIFPHGMAPSVQQIAKAAEDLFVFEDVHNIGANYDPTLMAWFKNFDRSWPKLKERYPDRFYRMWKYYLLSCAGGSRSRHFQLWQFVFSKRGVEGGYERPQID